MIKNLTKKVEYILKHYPETRDCDILLTTKVWEKFYPEAIIQGEYVKISSLKHLPREDNIKRIRAKFNAEKKYLPTSLKVAQRRKLNIDIWRLAMRQLV